VRSVKLSGEHDTKSPTDQAPEERKRSAEQLEHFVGKQTGQELDRASGALIAAPGAGGGE
jgi:hypothetical protein